ncbi:MAG: hypothetical protein WBE38_12725 [Terracidiphilus sp.]|jgi:hypothetical protein
MSETFEEPGVAVEVKLEVEPHAEPETLAVSMHDFSALEDRVLRAVDLVKHARQERAAAEERAAQNEERATQAEAHAVQAGERAAQAEAKLREQGPVVDGMQSELRALKAERDQVRQRVERLLEQLDGLEL